MICFGCCLVLLAAPNVEAEAQSSPPPVPRPAPYFSSREAPENLVYKIFFREFVALRLAADQASAQGKDGAVLRTLFQRTMGLFEHENQALASAAQTCVAELDRNQRATQQLAEELKQTADQAAVRAKLAQLHAASEAAVSNGVRHLRESLPPERFARLDRIIRVRVTQNLKIVPGRGSAKARSGGN